MTEKKDLIDSFLEQISSEIKPQDIPLLVNGGIGLNIIFAIISECTRNKSINSDEIEDIIINLLINTIKCNEKKHDITIFQTIIRIINYWLLNTDCDIIIMVLKL